MRKRALLSLALMWFWTMPHLVAQTNGWLHLDEGLSLRSPQGAFRSDLSGLLDLEAYYIDQRPPGVLYGEDSRNYLFNPRLSLFLDTRLGEHLYSLVQVRFDRGFDPGAEPHGAARFDEYLLRYSPFDGNQVNLQAGKFATVFGSWVQRHDSWHNPFITAPLPYENITIINAQIAPGSPRGFLLRRNRPDNKETWVPAIWGPSYASGASLFGTVEKLDYAFEVKNASLSSRPAEWDPLHRGWDHPTVSGRAGYRPNASWNVGASASYGDYFQSGAVRTLPLGTGLGDFHQLVVGQDLSFSWRHWQFWAETMVSRFETPTVGNADTIMYYLEAKYRFTPHLFGAVRWNQQLFDTINDGISRLARWDRDAWRAEAALGYRFNRHLQTKLQYSFSRQNGPFQQGEQLVAGQITLKF